MPVVRVARIAALGALLSALAACGDGAAPEISGREREGSQVPNVVGMDVSEARAALDRDRFELVVAEEVACEESSPGTVVSQHPASLEWTTGDEVEVVITVEGSGPCAYEPPPAEPETLPDTVE